MKKVLLFDLTSAQSPKVGSKYSGIILYTTAIFYKLMEKKSNDIDIKALYIPGRYMIDGLYQLCEKHNIELVETIDDQIIETVKKVNPSLYFTPFPTKNRIVDSGVKMLTVCHDLRTTDICFDKLYWRFIIHWKEWIFLLDSILFKGYLQRKNMINIAKRFIGHENIKFIAVSQHTRHHIMIYFPEYFKKDVKVFYSPMLENVDENCEEAPIEEIKKMGLSPNKYFFMDSGWRWSKNDLRAAIALDRILKDQKDMDFKVVISGVKKREPYYKYIKNKDKFVLLNYVERDVLNTLHKFAHATIYPTLGEGFGYTPMESFKYGVPVIAGANSSVMEVCGDAALYCNPYSIQEIQNRCYQMMDDTIYTSVKSKTISQYHKISSLQKKHLDDFVEYILNECRD